MVLTPPLPNSSAGSPAPKSAEERYKTTIIKIDVRFKLKYFKVVLHLLSMDLNLKKSITISFYQEYNLEKIQLSNIIKQDAF